MLYNKYIICALIVRILRMNFTWATWDLWFCFGLIKGFNKKGKQFIFTSCKMRYLGMTLQEFMLRFFRFPRELHCLYLFRVRFSWLTSQANRQMGLKRIAYPVRGKINKKWCNHGVPFNEKISRYAVWRLDCCTKLISKIPPMHFLFV